MSLRADFKYTGTITKGELIESRTGTPGFQILIEAEEGAISHTIWITPNTVEYAKRDLETIGADVTKLNSKSYLEHQLPADVNGVEVVFGTKEESYNGKASIKVAWIGKPKAPTADSIFGSVAAMFGGGEELPEPASSGGGADDDIPF